MADNRKGFRPRRLAFGGRSFPCACSLAAALAICAAAIGPAGAEDAGLKNGAASLSAGKYDAAVRQLSSTINSDNAAPADAARALYLRGLAYRKMGDSARAIADLGAAIWLGLPEPDKVKAFVNRGLAYKSAGLSREGDAEFASARKIGGSAVDTLIAEGGGVGEGAAAVAAFSTEVHPAGGRRRATAGPQRSRRAADTDRRRLAHGVEHLGRRRTAIKQREQRQPPHALVRLGDRFLILIRTHAASRTRPGAAGGTATEAGGATALGRRGELELVHDHRDATGGGDPKRRRKRQPLVAPVQPQRRSRASGATGAVRLGRRLPAATRHQPLGSRSQGAVEEGLAEPGRRRRSTANREGRYRQFRHLLEPPHRTLHGQGGKP